MSILAELPGLSRWSLYLLLGAFGLIMVIVLTAQVGCLRGKPFQNPDGTKDDWREQKVFYGIACPRCSATSSRRVRRSTGFESR